MNRAAPGDSRRGFRTSRVAAAVRTHARSTRVGLTHSRACHAAEPRIGPAARPQVSFPVRYHVIAGQETQPSGLGQGRFKTSL